MKAFGWLQLLQRGDLTLKLKGPRGHSLRPIQVQFRTFQVRADGSKFQVGPIRTPVEGALGEFYVTGYAGELGQPGEWEVEWRYQKDRGSPVQIVQERFLVKDAVSAKTAKDVTVRKNKTGWY